VFATLLCYAFRAWTWHKYRVYIDVQALQISLLGGRIFFKGFKYHGNNETILIHSGFVTWCYWLRNVRGLSVSDGDETRRKRTSTEFDNVEKAGHSASVGGAEEGGSKDATQLPCRFTVTLNGVEWVVYNRSVAYDAVIAGMIKHVDSDSEPTVEKEKNEPADFKVRNRKKGNTEKCEESLDYSGSSSSKDTKEESDPGRDPGFLRSQKSSSSTETETSDEKLQNNGNPEGAFILRLLPIHVTCNKAAVVLGNENTKSVLIAKADGATGEIDATRCKTIDQYRQLINFNFNHPVIQIKPNDDYKEDQTTAAIRIKRGEKLQTDKKPTHVHSHSFIHRQRRKAWHTLQNLIPAFRSSVDSISSSNNTQPTPATLDPGTAGWQGLSRYLDENEQDDKAKWSSIEYATVTTIADSPAACMSFYWDVPGTVGERRYINDEQYCSEAEDINGAAPPEWGLDLTLNGAIVNYGPWADRQRADIQRVFFPSLCKDAIPSKKLATGQFRVPTEFKVYIQFDEETILRVPIKEESKNWKWTKHVDSVVSKQTEQKKRGSRYRKRKADSNAGPEIRPFGWLDVKVGANTTVTYTMDMLAGPFGFSNSLEIDLPNIEITTSVNHGLLWRSVNNRISCDLSNPLQWNGQHVWKFDVNSRGLELFILREHVFLLQDLVEDWASGPPPEYLTFSPFKYLVNLRLDDFRIYLNVNDSNIINNPSDFDDNTFIIIFGSVLSANIGIPLDTFRPYRNDISFDVDASNGGLNLHIPPWNTQATFLSSTELATLKNLKIGGKYQYCATTSASNTDTLLLDVYGDTPTAQFYGFVIRYYLKIKDNYFGDDIHFKTLEEYQEVLGTHRHGGNSGPDIPPHKKSNDLDVILSVKADRSSVILPCNLYTAKNHIRIEIASLATDMRFTNYYMDLDVMLSTMAFSSGSEELENETPLSTSSNTQLFVDGINVVGNRLFGLPPTEPTYVCNWDFAIGAVTGECSTDFFNSLLNGVKAFAFSFDDDENAQPSISVIEIHDVTFLRATVESIQIWLHVEEAAFLFSTAEINLNFNDWAGTHYSKRLNLLVPQLHIGCVDAESASRHRSRAQHAVETHAFVQTTLSVAMIERKLGFAQDRLLQQEHIKLHDQRTHRTEFLLHRNLLDHSMLTSVDPPALPIPPMPAPIVQDVVGDSKSRSSMSEQSSARRSVSSVKRKSSFLSLASSGRKSNNSVLRPQSMRNPPHVVPDELRSRTLLDTYTSGHHGPTRDVSASTGRRSSFYSAVGEHKGLAPSSVTFSSSYMAPYFPLEGIKPDRKNLPAPGSFSDQESAQEYSRFSLDDIRADRVDEHATHVSFIIELSTGLQGVFNPSAVGAVNNLLAALQPVSPNDLLDSLQIASINEIFELRKQKNMTGKVMDLSVNAPTIDFRLLNSSSSSAASNYDMVDQYDLSLSRLALTSRSVTALKIDGHQAAQNSSSLQLSLQSAEVSAKERLGDMDDPQAAINGIVEDVNCWFVSNAATAASVAFKTFEVATVSSKIEYLASLLHRTGTLASDTANSFSMLSDRQQTRMQLFTYFVATQGQQATDPMFLTRPSYVLRTAPDHLRSSDSWKVVTRLHHMYDSLSPDMKQDLGIRCISVSESLPQDAERRVLAGFDHWRSWDLNDVDSCLVMKRVFGVRAKDVLQPIQVPQTLKFTLRTEAIRLVLDPGPKQNEVSLQDITTVFEDKTEAMKAETQSPFHGDDVHHLLLQIFCASTAINLNWELCELADDIMNLYLQSSKASSQEEIMKPKNARATSKARRDLHVTMATDASSITLDTVNIRAASLCNGLKASFVMIDDANSETTKMINLVIAAAAATSKFKTRSQDLTVYQIRLPSIYTSFEVQPGSGTPVRTIKIAGNCRQLSFSVQQDILALIEVLDLVIGDEVAQLHRLKERIPSTSPTPVIENGAQNDNGSITKVNVALFLDEYRISVLLLQSLTYNITGLVARASVAAQPGSDIIFDFDIKEHSHDIQTWGASSQKSISLLQMPPTNGRMASHMSDSENVVSVFASVEPIHLDAAAVHSLLSALNRPEISSVVTDIKEDFKAVQGHFEEIFGPKSKAERDTPLPTKPLIYDAHLTLAGFNIFANAHESKGGSTKASLDFNLGCVQVLVANRLEQIGAVLAFPEIRVVLRQISFELCRWDKGEMQPCGNLAFAAFLTATSKINDVDEEVRSFHLKSDGLKINLLAETASTVIDVIEHLQTKIKDIDFSREKHYLRKLRKLKPKSSVEDEEDCSAEQGKADGSIDIFASTYSLELLDVQICWIVGTYEVDSISRQEREDLVLSLKRIEFSTRKKNTARLTMEDLQVQMVPASQDKRQRSLNSALLPEIIFNVGYVSTFDARRFAFQAAGKSLDLRLTSQFMIPGAAVKKSVGSAVNRVREASAKWSSATSGPTAETRSHQPFFGKKRIESLLVDADFAGAVVYLSGKKVLESSRNGPAFMAGRAPQPGRYGQFTQTDASSSTVLRAPGLAWKVEYKDDKVNDPSLNAEIKVDASSNTLYPAVVPLIMEISSTVKDIVSDEDKGSTVIPPKVLPQKFMSTDEDNILTTDPSAVLGRTRLNIGFRICRQEFTLSCQPIARVSATARFDDIYVTINTVKSTEHGHFFAASAIFTRLQASVQHVYSRESTGSFDVDSVFLSLMNSKHVSGISGVSTILKISPMKILVNAKQIQDFLLFREIWVPSEIRQQTTTPAPIPTLAPTTSTMQSQTYLVQRYQQVAATGAFPWNATVSIAELDVQLDLGQAIGRSAFIISNFWVSSKKNSDWEQNLCLGFDKVGVDSTGRMSGFVTLQDFHVRTSIQWPAREMALNQTPLVQASLRFSQFRVKAAFEYQAFLVADITSLEFLMYNVRNGPDAKGDRLVAILDGDAVQVFCTTTTASQALALYQAFVRLAQEKRTNYKASLMEIEKFTKRKSISQPVTRPQDLVTQEIDNKVANSPISLHTDVIVTLKALNMGAFPNTFSDHQVFKLEALNAQARFAVTMDQGKIHSILGLTLGQLRIGLAAIKHIDMPKSVGDLSVEDVVNSATGSRGGTILKVPKVEATMQTWQVPSSNHIDYIFKSSFEGKVEVGWNYSRISYIRSMWAAHAKALAQRLGKPLPPSAVKITGVPDEEDGQRKGGEQQKITAEVNVPQSKYDYMALQPPIIETPQLRDMGEATPP
jgi:hypothetical protein